MTDDLNKAHESEALEPERLVGAADEDPPADALDRAWAKTQAALAQPAEEPAKDPARESWHRPRVEWWVAGFVTAAALFMFAVLMGRQSGVPLSMPTEQAPGGDPDVEVRAEEIAAWIAQLTDEDFARRQEAWRKLLRGGGKAHQALNEFKSGGDAGQDKLVEDLRYAHEVLAELRTIPDSESLAFWRAVWRAEVASQPNLWSTGIAMNPADPVPAAPPSKLMQEVLDARFGEAKAKDVAAHFRKTFDALQDYATWHRQTDVLTEKKRDLGAERRQMDGLLQAVADSGNAAAPVVLSILQIATPAQRGMDWQTPRPKGILLPYPDDHLRMIVAAEKLGLKEAAPVLMRCILGEKRYPSPTIEAHAWGAVWRIYGFQEKAPNFPVAADELTDAQLAELWTWWVDHELKTWVPLLGDEDHEKREEAHLKLVELGSRVKAAIDRLPPADDPEVAARLRKIREIYFDAEECKTVEEAVAVLDRLNLDLDRSGFFEAGRFQSEPQKRIEQVYARIHALAQPEQADLVVANLRFEHGMRHYKKFRQGSEPSNSDFLKRASVELEKALDLYDKHLQANPNDKAVQNRQTECAMIHYACRKYQVIDSGGDAAEKPAEAKKEAPAEAAREEVPVK